MTQTKETRSTCPYCGVGCGVIIGTQQGRITAVRGDPEHPANFGRLCSKGSSLHLSARHELAGATRLLQPQRRGARGGLPEALSWDAALQWASARLAAIVRAHGPDAVGFYVSGQLLTEDYYVFNKLAKGLIGTNNIDTNSRLCMSSAVAGYKLTLGADAPPACYDDLPHANCLFIAGSNAAWAHPVLFRRIEDARARNPDLRIIVADPRRTDTAASADLHLQLQPGTDVMLFHGMLHLMLREGWIAPAYIRDHTEGFDALRDLVADCTPASVQAVCGIEADALLRAARWFALGGHDDPSRRAPTLSLYCQGLNQSSSGTAKNASLINLHLATAQIGRAGAGPFSLTGQPNAMGGREVGGLANLLSAHRDLANPAHRAEVARLWGIDEVPAQPGKTAVEMFEAAADGEIRALWIACTNPAQSMPDQATVRRALERAEFVVVQEAFASAETCAFADLLLPATTWGEKEGTVTNSERRISRVRAAVAPPGEARHDWQIVVDLAQRLQKEPGIARGKASLRMDYATAESIWREHRESTRGRDLDITGLSYAQLEAAPRQWPAPEGRATGQARLYEDGAFATASGRARFAALPYQPVAESRSSDYPFSLNTGRLRDQWHGMTRTGLVARLFGHVPEPVVQLHPDDMRELGLRDGELARVASKRGELVLPCEASADLGRHQAFVAMHWGQAHLSGRDAHNRPLAGINGITTSVSCASSRQPELKHAAVSVRRAELQWSLLALAWFPAAGAVARMQALRARMSTFEFASCVPFASGSGDHARHGVLFRAACSEAPALADVLAVEQHLGLASGESLRYLDATRTQLRSMRVRRGHGASDGAVAADANAVADTFLDALLIAGDTSAGPWLKALLQQEGAVQAYGRRLLMSGREAPLAMAVQSRLVCSCIGVRADAIEAQIGAQGAAPPPAGDAAACGGTARDEASAASGAQSGDQCLARLQAALRCGTQCGSCVPELRRMISAARPVFPSPNPA